MPDARATLRFRDFELDLAAYDLRRQGQRVRLERRAMDLLILLVERRQQLVTRAEIVERLWGKDVFVDVETGVNTLVFKVRQALRDLPEAPAYVETVPGKGYRFIAPVEVVSVAVDVAPGAAAPAAPLNVAPRSRRLVVVLVALVLVAGVVAWLRPVANPPASSVTLAVLPFENLGGDRDRDYLVDGLAEEAIASFGQVDPQHLSVIGRTSTLAYKGTRKSLADIGRELGADYLVEGSIRTEGKQLRITCRLVRVRDQRQVWSASYDREPTSVIGLQRELSTAICGQIRLRLSPERLDALARRNPSDAGAYDLYLRGRHYQNQLTPETNKRATEFYERAIALDPNYALAWAGIAGVLVASPINSDAPPLQVASLAREAAARAVAAGPDLAEPQTVLGQVKFFLEWDWPAAEAALRRAISLDASHAVAHRYLAHVLSQAGRHQQAMAAMRRARALDPLYAMNHATFSQIAFQARDYAAAAEHARQAIVIDPEFWIGHINLGQAYEQLGQPDLAPEEFVKAARFSGGNTKALSFRGHLLARQRRVGEARDVLTTLEGLSRDRYVPPYAIALVSEGLGEADAAFAALARAYDARDIHLIFLTVDPRWDPYRSDPRFRALVARCGFTRSK
jgi:TolB-like protein/DNA-binding winged helix-turn-helix (wHTH) protein/Tfp pilus assembly protein PilF